MSQSYCVHPALAELGGVLAHRADRILDNASRVNGERYYSTEKLLNLWLIATQALLDDLDQEPDELVRLLEHEVDRRRRPLTLSENKLLPRIGVAPSDPTGIVNP